MNGEDAATSSRRHGSDIEAAAPHDAATPPGRAGVSYLSVKTRPTSWGSAWRDRRERSGLRGLHTDENETILHRPRASGVARACCTLKPASSRTPPYRSGSLFGDGA